jgi:hypothetical protein
LIIRRGILAKLDILPLLGSSPGSGSFLSTSKSAEYASQRFAIFLITQPVSRVDCFCVGRAI